jgi:EF hand
MPGRGGPGPRNAQFAGRGPVDRSAIAEAIFRRLDTNHDGSITKAEFISAHGRMQGPAGVQHRPGDRDGAKKKAEFKKDAGKKGESKSESKKNKKSKKGDKDDDDGDE